MVWDRVLVLEAIRTLCLVDVLGKYHHSMAGCDLLPTFVLLQIARVLNKSHSITIF